MKKTRFVFAAGLVLALAATASFAQTPALTFTVETTTSGGTAVVPRLKWAATPAAGATCTASAVPVATDWTGTKAVSGDALLGAITATRSYTLACAWPGGVTTTLLTWIAPTANHDGTPYTNPGGFRIQWGKTAADLDQSFYLENPAARTWTSPALANGPWFFAVRAYNVHGLESPLSNVATKTIAAGATQSRTLEVAVKFPNAPTGLTSQ